MVLICFDIHLGVVGSAITKLDTARRTEHTTFQEQKLRAQSQSTHSSGCTIESIFKQ